MSEAFKKHRELAIPYMVMKLGYDPNSNEEFKAAVEIYKSYNYITGDRYDPANYICQISEFLIHDDM